MRVSPVLSQKVTRLAADQRASRRRAPMLAVGLRVFGFGVHAAGILADRRFEREAAIGVDGIRRAADQLPGRPAIGRENQRRALVGHGFAGIASDEHPFARLSFDLNHVQHVLVGARRARCHIRRLPFQR